MILPLAGLLGAVAGLGEQLLGHRRIERVGVLRIAEARVGLLEEADRRLRRAVEQRHEAGAVDAVVDRLAHLHVAERRIRLGRVQHPRPHMRIAVGDEAEAGLLEAVDGVGRRHLDPVDLARAQRRETRVRLRHREQDDLVDLGDARLVPVVGVLVEIDADARLEVLGDEGAGADRRLGELGPASGLLEGRRADVEDRRQDIGEIGDRPRRREFDRVVVDLFVAAVRDVGRASRD